MLQTWRYLYTPGRPTIPLHIPDLWQFFFTNLLLLTHMGYYTKDNKQYNSSLSFMVRKGEGQGWWFSWALCPQQLLINWWLQAHESSKVLIQQNQLEPKFQNKHMECTYIAKPQSQCSSEICSNKWIVHLNFLRKKELSTCKQYKNRLLACLVLLRM